MCTEMNLDADLTAFAKVSRMGRRLTWKMKSYQLLEDDTGKTQIALGTVMSFAMPNV